MLKGTCEGRCFDETPVFLQVNDVSLRGRLEPTWHFRSSLYMQTSCGVIEGFMLITSTRDHYRDMMNGGLKSFRPLFPLNNAAGRSSRRKALTSHLLVISCDERNHQHEPVAKKKPEE